VLLVLSSQKDMRLEIDFYFKMVEWLCCGVLNETHNLTKMKRNGYKRSVPLPIPVTSLFRSRSIPKTWVYAQNGNDRRLTLIKDT
jgi:hypothetical protein